MSCWLSEARSIRVEFFLAHQGEKMTILGYLSLEQFHATAQYHWHVWLSTINDWKLCCRVTWLQFSLKTDGSIFCIFWLAVWAGCNLQFDAICNSTIQSIVWSFNVDYSRYFYLLPIDCKWDLNPCTWVYLCSPTTKTVAGKIYHRAPNWYLH